VSVRYDRTPAAVTAYCDCGWIELTLGLESARRLAVDHETRVHPQCRQVREAARMREHRHAAQAHHPERRL
jgi:hypothetical protein